MIKPGSYWGIFFAFALLLTFISCSKTERAFYPNGQKKFELPKNAGGKIHGEALWWYANGKLQLKADYTNGVLNGKMVRYEANGQIQSEDEFIDGRLNGLSKEYDGLGRLLVEKTYRNDTLHGPTRQFDEFGQVAIQGNYHNGFYDGHWLYFDRFGNVNGEGDFTKGKGLVKYYSSSGRLSAFCEYEDNLKHGREIYYDMEGNIALSRIYDFGELVSDSTLIAPGQ